jgi:general secretion pathway protein I
MTRQGQAGFTLIEMLIALAIFSLAALALLRVEGNTLVNTARLSDQAMAQIVARNIAVETLTDPVVTAHSNRAGPTLFSFHSWLRRRICAISSPWRRGCRWAALRSPFRTSKKSSGTWTRWSRSRGA